MIHTPGPWLANESQPGIFHIDSAITDDEDRCGMIATVWSAEGIEMYNAKLIAAAPTMFDFISKVIDRSDLSEDLRDEAISIYNDITNPS